MSAMKRRDLLKLVGIGGAGAVVAAVGGKQEVETTPVAEATICDQGGNVIYNLPDIYRDREYWEIGIEPDHEFYEEWREFKASLGGGA